MEPAMECLRTYSEIPIFVVEDHDEVVPVFHREMGSKHLPLSKVAFVHFDSHPDLLIPLTMQADVVFDKYELYQCQSIENWILPQVYAGHISDIYWLKPPWARQIPEKRVTFFVGKCLRTGHIRTTCKENYFVSEALYAREDQLTDKKEVRLTVIGVEPDDWNSKGTESLEAVSRKQEQRAPKTPALCGDCGGHTKPCREEDLFTSSSEIEQQRERSVSHNHCHVSSSASGQHLQQQCCSASDAWLDSADATHSKNTSEATAATIEVCDRANHSPCPLEHCLNMESDCGSGGQETLEPEGCESGVAEDDDYSGRERKAWRTATLERMVEELRGRSYILDIDLDFFSTKNPFRNLYSAKQMELLKHLYQFTAPTDSSEKAIRECVERRQEQLRELQSVFEALTRNPSLSLSSQLSRKRDQAVLEELVDELKNSGEITSGETTSGERTVDWELVHNAGCTIDDSELPHHISTESQILQLMQEVKVILQHLPRPTVITLARSSTDDYCPPDQVDFIEEAMVMTLEEVYLYTSIQKLYLDCSPNQKKEEEDQKKEKEEGEKEEEEEEEEEEEVSDYEDSSQVEKNMD